MVTTCSGSVEFLFLWDIIEKERGSGLTQTQPMKTLLSIVLYGPANPQSKICSASFLLIFHTDPPNLPHHMATNSLQSIHHPLLKHHHILDTPPPPLSSHFFLKPTSTNLSLSHTTTTFSLSSTTSSSTAQAATTFDLLQEHLSTKNYREADNETRRLLIALAGEAAVKRGYVFFSEVQFIPETDLKTIDNLWREHSNDRFGYSVQKKIYEKEKKDFTRFFIKVGWMKLLDTEVVQYNYKAFPNEFIWELTNDTPEGHLPLTNALRGTQLLNSIFYHPAFQGTEEEDGEEAQGAGNGGPKPLLNNNLFKTDYSF